MHKLLSDVRKFHETYKMPVLETATIPSKERIDLRLSLINEEIKELEKAIEDKDVVEVADALVDLMYVINGAILEFGMQKKLFDDSYEFASFFKGGESAKPHVTVNTNVRNNLGYLHTIVKELVTAINEKHMVDIIDCFTDLVEMVIVLAIDFGLQNYFYKCHNEVQASNMSKLGLDGKPIYREDGKVLKGPNFFKPNLKKILES